MMSSRDLSWGSSGDRRLWSNAYVFPPVTLRKTAACLVAVMSLAVKKILVRLTYDLINSVLG